MTLHTVWRDLSPTAERKETIETRSSYLGRYFQRLQWIEWSVALEGRACVATCRLHARSGDYRATGTAEAFEQAVHEASEKLVRQRRRRRVQAVRARQRPARIS